MEKPGYILLTDDSADDVELTTQALERQEFAIEIVTARDGAEALDFLFRRGAFTSRDEGDPILILLDIKMPKVNGLEVLAKVKSDARLRSIPVVMLTSSRQEPDVEECYRLAANAYVVKPLDFDEFAAAVGTIGDFWAGLNELPYSDMERASTSRSFD